MDNIEFRRVCFDRPQLAQYVGLFHACFPGKEKLTEDYLQWLYADNPDGAAIGYDAFSQGRLVAHYVVVPVVFAMAGGQRVKGCWSLNTATHPEFQGKGLFVRLAEKTYADAAIESCDFVVGVANQNSSHGFTRRLGFSNLGQLRTEFGYFRTRANGQTTGWGRRWDRATIAWRLKNPSMKYDRRLRDDLVTLSTSVAHKMINVDLCDLPIEYVDRAARMIVKDVLPSIRVVYGLPSAGLFVRVPQRLLPSPWNVIFRQLGPKQLVVPSAIQIVGLDLDTF